MCNTSRFLLTIIISKETTYLPSPNKIMKVFLLLLATSILGWQYLTVTSTLKSRIQERTNQIDYVINEYLGEI